MFDFIEISWYIDLVVLALYSTIVYHEIMVHMQQCYVGMLSLGILGEYLWRIFNVSRNRPPYIREEKRTKNSKTATKPLIIVNVAVIYIEKNVIMIKELVRRKI